MQAYTVIHIGCPVSGVSVTLLSILGPGLAGTQAIGSKKRDGKVIKKGRGVFAYSSVSDSIYLIFGILFLTTFL